MQSSRRRTLRRIVALSALAALALAGTAAAATGPPPEIPPPAIARPAPGPGMSITAFPERDMVVVGTMPGVLADPGYEVGDHVVVQVRRGGVLTAQAETVVTALNLLHDDKTNTDFVEINVNHPGNDCWGIAASDDLIVPGDVVSAFVLDGNGNATGEADTTTVADVNVGDYPRVDKDADGFAVAGADGLYAVTLRGRSNASIPASEIEAQLLLPPRDFFSSGRRDIRANTAGGGGARRLGGTLAQTGDTWTATWRLSREDAILALGADPSLTWLGPAIAGEQATISEFLAAPEGCGAGDPVLLTPLASAAATPEPEGLGDPNHIVGIFPTRDFVSVEVGANPGAGADTRQMTIELLRDGEVIAHAGPLTPEGDTGLVEVNHVGAACWVYEDGFPDIRGGDQVRVTTTPASGPTVVDVVTARDVAITADPPLSLPDPFSSVLDATSLSPVESRQAVPSGGAWTVTVSGYAQNLDGTALVGADAASLEVRLKNGRFRDLAEMAGKQDLRASTAGGAEPDPQRVVAYDTGTKRWTATFSGLSEAVKNVAMAVDTDQTVLAGATANSLTSEEMGPGAAPGPQCGSPSAAGIVRDVFALRPAPTPDPAPTPTPAPGPGAGGGGAAPTDPVVVPGPTGPTTVPAPNGGLVLRGQVDARSLAAILRSGVLSVVLEQKARPGGVLYRFKIRRVGGEARAASAAASGRPAAVFWRHAPRKAGRYRFDLRGRSLRGLAPGRYVVEVQAASRGRKLFGKPVLLPFTVA